MKLDSRPPQATLLVVVWSLWLCTYCHAQLLPQPRLLWSTTLEANGAHSLKKGNGVVASKDGVHIFATASNGSLHIVNRNNLSPLETIIFQPTTATGTSQCSSKPVLLFDGTSNAYAIYSVVDGKQSVVYGINFDGSLKWQVIVDGQIMGTPVVSSHAVYISHNIDSTAGYLSVLLFDSENNNDQNNNDHHEAPVLTATLAPTQGNAPLGPLALDIQNGQDVIAVAEWWDQGYGSQGNLYILLFAEEYDQRGGKGNDSYRMQHVSSWPFSAATSPLMVSSSLWLGASGANIGGWQQKDISKVLTGQKEDIDPKWFLQLDTKTGDAGQPFLTAPVISDDASTLVLAGTNGELYGLQSKDGRQQWTNVDGASAILAEPLIVGDVLYVIESQSGSVRQHSLWGGDQIWQINCNSDNPFCGNPVEADFTISPNGALLYYGDVFGNIVALQVGTVDTPSPTMAPTTVAPTLNPSFTTVPTEKPDESQNDAPAIDDTHQDGQDSDAEDISGDSVTNLAGNEDSDYTILIIGSAVGGFFVLLAAVALCMFCRKRCNRKKDSKHKNLNEDYGYKKPPSHSQSSNLELDYGTPDKTAPVAPPKADTPDTFGFDSDSEAGMANNKYLPSSNDSTRDLTDTFSLVAPSETDDATNKDGMPCDASHMSEESNLPVPPPPTKPIPKQVQAKTTSVLQPEEKDEVDTRNDSLSYANMYGDNSVDDLQFQSQVPVSPTSTVSESSVYTGQPSNAGSPGNSFSNLTPRASKNAPVLPDVFGNYIDQDSIPDDEARMASSCEQSQLTKQQPFQHKHASGSDDESNPDDESNDGPGAHYTSKNSQQQKKLCNTVAIRRGNSMDGSGAKFGASRQIESSLGIVPGPPDTELMNPENWNSFMDELEEAEKMFSEPNLKSSRLLSDDESTDAGSSFMGLINNSLGNMLGSDRGFQQA